MLVHLLFKLARACHSAYKEFCGEIDIGIKSVPKIAQGTEENIVCVGESTSLYAL